MSKWKPEYLCVLDPGCSEISHTPHCREKNEEYAEAAWKLERERRLAQIEAVIREMAHSREDRDGPT